MFRPPSLLIIAFSYLIFYLIPSYMLENYWIGTLTARWIGLMIFCVGFTIATLDLIYRKSYFRGPFELDVSTTFFFVPTWVFGVSHIFFGTWIVVQGEYSVALQNLSWRLAGLLTAGAVTLLLIRQLRGD